jgi:methylenetetrahydrofolate reductase (NADPH)
MGLRENLASGKFCVTVELAPPKGTDVSRMMRVAEPLIGRVDGVNITDNQRAVMRLSSLASCHLLAELGLDPIMQLTCRDRNRLALQSEVLSAIVLGTRNIVAMTGDHPLMGDHPSA